jgi:Flp pilus assembly pilin Flp
MHGRIITLYVKLQNLVSSEEGQDLVEYGLLCSMIALSLISGVGHVATAVSHIFTNVSSSLA